MKCAVGNVLRIEKTSIHDGAGLRTVFFLKGCPLRCVWCSTPESQSPLVEKGYYPEKCTLCGVCVSSCPTGALSTDKAHAGIVTDRNSCTGCMRCVLRCPNSALKGFGEMMTSAEAVREIAKDEMFFFHSGGGVTFSGGEPLEQSNFVREILEGCRKIGINCAMETSFFADWGRIEPLLPFLGLLYVDLKHIEPAWHKRLTGVDNSVILENIKTADKSAHEFEIILRIPLIPGVNDSDSNLESSANFARSITKVKGVELLAYHRLGIETYCALGLEYKLTGIQPPGADYMAEKAKIFKSSLGKPVLINGVPL
ncbi:MAG: glycyl-radical enzyme activating protein [Synergistaceae bacterium]|nr:glycyl-radical enzyme activating protein [Synergistaceae bacterium]